MNKLLIVSSKATHSADQKLRKMASFFCADVSLVEYRNPADYSGGFMRVEPSVSGLVLHPDTLGAFADAESLSKSLRNLLLDGGNVFLYGISQKTSATLLGLL